jgi:predicted nucleotidyltransferase
MHDFATRRPFGSVTRSDASADSDLDPLVDLLPDAGTPLLRVAGMSEESARSWGAASMW